MLLFSSISHDLKTSFLVIQSSLNCIKTVLPDLVKAYDLALAKGLIEPSIEASLLEKISKSIDLSREEIKLADYRLNKLNDALKADIAFPSDKEE